MTYYRDEIAIVAENLDPIPFEEAVVNGMAGKTFVFVSPTEKMSQLLFEWCRTVFPPALIRVTNRKIYLRDAEDGRVLFLTEFDVEHNALRGLGKVVWVC